MAHSDHVFQLEGPAREAQGWFYAVVGLRRARYGPFQSAPQARADAQRRFHRWRQRAQARGGWAWVKTAREWVVTLPEGLAAGGLPLCREACTRHERRTDQGQRAEVSTASRSSTPP